MIATEKEKDAATEFPENALLDALATWWAKEAQERVDDPFYTVPQTKGTIYELLPALDSLSVVESFLIIEKILAISVPVSLIKSGGYCSREEMLEDLLPKLRKIYEKRRR
jgi:hypothetical protein